MARGKPAQVSLILGDRVQLDGLQEPEFWALRAHGLDPAGNAVEGWHLVLRPSEQPVTEKPDGQRVLVALARAGIAFLRDPRLGWSPADLIELLVERGGYSGPFRVCAFDGERWHVSVKPRMGE